MSKAKLKYSSTPRFRRFNDRYHMDIYEWLNHQEYTPNSTYFIYNNYTPVGDRMFFTEENGIRIDGIRQSIEELKNNRIIDEDEYNFLIASLLESVTRYSNTSGTYEAFFKFWDSRALNEFIIEPLAMNETNGLRGFVSYSEDTNQLVRRIEGDIAYIDPPVHRHPICVSLSPFGDTCQVRLSEYCRGWRQEGKRRQKLFVCQKIRCKNAV